MQARALFDGLTTQIEGVSFGVGWAFQSEDDGAERIAEDDEEGSGGEGRLNDVRGLVDAALLAAIESVDTRGPEQFTLRLWSSSLARARKAGEYNRVVADFELFSNLGLTSPYAETQMGFLYFSGPKQNFELAEALFRQAASRPAIPLVVANLGCYLIVTGKAEEGFGIIRDLDIPEGYYAAMFYGAFVSLDADAFAAFVTTKRDLVPRALEGQYAWVGTKKYNEVSEALRAVY